MKNKIIFSESEFIEVIKKIVKEQTVTSRDATSVVNPRTNLYSKVRIEPKNDKSKPLTRGKVIILVSGLYEGGYKNVKEQEMLLKQGYSGSRNVYGIPWRKADSVYNKVGNYPEIIVVLFSRATGFSDVFAKNMVNKNNLYILEPYPGAKGAILGAISAGVPKKNVILGGGTGSGLGLIPGASKTPKEYGGHWASLTYVGTILP